MCRFSQIVVLQNKIDTKGRESANSEKHAAFTRYEASQEAAYLVVSKVAKAILAGQVPAVAGR